MLWISFSPPHSTLALPPSYKFLHLPALPSPPTATPPFPLATSRPSPVFRSFSFLLFPFFPVCPLLIMPPACFNLHTIPIPDSDTPLFSLPPSEMEMLPNFVVSAGIKMPIGYRFCPTDEELIVHYLRKMALGLPLPANVIPLFDVFQTDPWKLPGVGVADSMEKGYFFSKNEDVFYGGIIVIADGTGFWKPTGKEKSIISPRSNQVIGTRRNLVFCGGDFSDDAETEWVMHELRLTVPGMAALPPRVLLPWTKWAVYRVFQKKKKPKNKRKRPTNSKATHSLMKKLQKVGDTAPPSVIDFAAAGHDDSDEVPPPPPSPSPSEGSDVTASNHL